MIFREAWGGTVPLGYVPPKKKKKKKKGVL